MERLGLYEAVRETCHGMECVILELYCPSIGTFFTPIGELGLSLHEMWELSKLPVGHFPYEEYFSCPHKLQQLSSQNRALYETFLELMCHFHICLDVHGV